MNALVFNCLVIETTDRCNARCAMCYQASGPKGSDIRGDYKLTVAECEHVILQAAALEGLASRVHVSGGEGFLNFSDLLKVFSFASSQGFQKVGATTNAYWANTDNVADAKCRKLVEAGVNYLEISYDIWHQPYVKRDRVRTALRAARRAGIHIVLRLLSTQQHGVDEALEGFEDNDLLDVEVSNSRVQLTGRAAKEIDKDEVYYPSNALEGTCDAVLNLTIAPNGNIYPCCAGSEMTEALSFGNIREVSLANAVLRMKTDQLFRQLIHGGTGTLLPIVNALGFGDRLADRHTGICHLCWDIFKDNEIAAALRSHFAEEQFEMLVRLAEAALSPAHTPCCG